MADVFPKPNPGDPCIIQIAGRRLELRFTLKALKELKVKYGFSFLKPQTLPSMLEDPETFATILSAALSSNADVTQEWVEENIDSRMFVDLTPAIGFALYGTLPGDVPPNAISPEAPNSPGSTSGPSDGTTSAVVN